MSRKKESPLDYELHQACQRGNAKRVREILQCGRVYVDCQSPEDGVTPLMLAILGHYPECIMTLLDEGADPNMKKKNGLSSLMLASQLGFKRVVQDLISFGANIDDTNKDGGTALMFACQWGWIEVVQQLIENGCNIHKAMQDGTTALFLAAQAGQNAIVTMLIEACEKRSRNVGILIAAPRRDGATPLFIAAQMGHLQCVKVLLAHGAEVDQSRIDDVTPLFKACHKGHISVVKELIKHNANTGVLQNGESCLHAAALSGDIWTVRTLLRLGVDTNVKNRDGKTAVDLASEAEYHEIAKLIKLFMRNSSAPPAIVSRSKRSSVEKDGCGASNRTTTHVRFALENNVFLKKSKEDEEKGPVERVQCRLLTPEEVDGPKLNPIRMMTDSRLLESEFKYLMDRDGSPDKKHAKLLCLSSLL